MKYLATIRVNHEKWYIFGMNRKSPYHSGIKIYKMILRAMAKERLLSRNNGDCNIVDPDNH
jgi:hypothetical protein